MAAISSATSSVSSKIGIPPDWKIGNRITSYNVCYTKLLRKENVAIKTYQDHRMAMAFAPLALKVPVVIEEAEVVSKSYPDFWSDLKTIGFHIAEI